MRRLVVDLPPSRAALWSGRLALFACCVVAIAVLLARLDRIDLAPALAVLGTGLAMALAAVALAVSAFFVIWADGRPGFSGAMGGLLLAAVLMVWPCVLAVQALRLPRLSDVSTDVVDPPSFSRSRKALEARGGATPPEVAREQRQQQQQAYPGVAPILLDFTPQETYALALKAAQQRGWQIIETAQPGGRTGIGRIEAIDRSLVMRFPSDVTVRVRPLATGARVDVRSASRRWSHDFGENARRVQNYAQALLDLAEAKD
ncbi:MAG: DUF1499 domain-containing protein [Alsobacter sp.]